MREIEPSGLYIIRDSFFEQYGNDRYMQNKGENRPTIMRFGINQAFFG